MMESPTGDHVSDRVEDSPRPSITDRLAHLCASRELLEFYRGKVTQFDGEHEDLLEKYRCTTEDQKLQWEVGVSELQKALREREQALRLYSENNILKIREREDSKRIQHLLALVGPDIGGITYSHSDPPFKVGGRSPGSILPHCLMSHYMTSDRERYLVAEGNQKSRSEGVVNGGSSEQYRSANQTLVLQVLPAQMEEQTGLSKEKVESLLEDPSFIIFLLCPFSLRLEGTQNLTDESSRDFLKLKFETQAREMVEKDRLLRELDTNQDRLREARDSHGREPPGSRGPSSVDRSDKMAKRLQMMTQRYEALKKRAAMEVERFKSDIKHLKQKLKDVEKQLFKVSMGQMLYACVLPVVRQINVKTRKVQGELKAKIYELEKDLHYS
uniref:Uncharacterized protein n=1 Tax=Oncorhynchus tshawytscha TaxID=74940 RepID=A0A8C8I7M0_ONCTS